MLASACGGCFMQPRKSLDAEISSGQRKKQDIDSAGNDNDASKVRNSVMVTVFNLDLAGNKSILC